MMKAGILAQLTFMLFVTVGHIAVAETMDMDTTNLVITKLEKLLQTLDTDATSKIPMTMRLADLHADRARLLEMKEDAKTARQDRLAAIDLYNSVFKNLDSEQKSTVLSQVAHLYQMTNQKEKAENLFKEITSGKGKYSPEVVAQAHIGLGDIEIDRNNYKKAQKHFEAALKTGTQRRNYSTSRLAWCYFHLGQYARATKTIHDLLVSGKQLDNAFRDEAAHDYATFLAQGNVGPKEIKSLSDVSADDAKKTNLVYLATELDRIGKKNAALGVWKVVGEQNHTAGGLEDQFKVVQIQYDLGHRAEAVDEMTKLFTLWKSKGCDSKLENCDLVKAKVKKLVTDWGAAEERNPTPILIKAYSVYLAEFPEKDMSYWAAQAARKLKMNNEAIGFYRLAADLAETEKSSKVFEGSLLGEIEVAELTKDAAIRDQAYNHYLQKNPNGPEAANIRYQKAHVLYEQQKFSESAEAFHNIALTNDSKQMELREKAADTSIEALIAAKDDARLEKWSLEYAAAFPKRQAEFQKVARDTVLNREATKINSGDASRSELEGSLQKLALVNLKSASDKEKLTVYKSRLAVAEKLQNIPEVEKAAHGILSVRSATKEDHELALSRLEWTAELTLKFKEAYRLAQKINMSQLSTEERLMKMALLSELAGVDSTGYYEQFLKASKDPAAKQQVAAKLVRRARGQEAALQKYRNYLSAEIMGQLALEIFAKSHDLNFVARVLKQKNVRNTASGQILHRFVFLRDFQEFQRTHKAGRIVANDARALKKSLRERLNLIKNLETQANQAIRTGDWTLELITLDSVMRQNVRLAKDISSLPIPKNLKKPQRDQYKQLLAQQAQPYSVKAQEISNKISELWSNADISKVFEEIKNSKEPLRGLQKRELQLLAKFVPDSQKNKFASEFHEALAESKKVPSHKNLTDARLQVKANPFDAGKISDLKVLEQKAGHETFVAYLDGRLIQLQKGVRQ